MVTDLICLGEPLVEFNPVNGEPLDSARSFSVDYGGDTSNVAVAARRSGADVGYATRIGDDAFGDALLRLWTDEGIDTALVERELHGTTGIYFISRDPEHSAFTYYRSNSPATRMSPAWVPETAIRTTRALHISGISQAISTSACDAVFRAIEVAKDAGTLVSYDPNHRPALWETGRARAVIRQTVTEADLVMPNLSEGRLLTGFLAPEDVLAKLVDLGPRIIVLKLGSAGALLAHGGEITRFAAPRVDAIDSTGAGDAFDGAFLAQLLAGASPRDAAEYAVHAAALTTLGPGAVDPIPDRSAVLETRGLR
ncbi:MAG: sugar kinase [Nocardioides sp.]|nr:sugar kinase [Nocardioides sp.]